MQPTNVGGRSVQPDNSSNGHGLVPAADEVISSGWKFRSLIEIAAHPPLPPGLVRTNGSALIYREIPTMISGPPEACKTFVAMIAAVEVIRDDGDVVWIDTDGSGPGDLLERLRGFGLPDQVIDAQFHYEAPDCALDRNELARMLEPCCPQLIVWDTWGSALALFGLEDSTPGVEAFRRRCMGIIPGASEILTEHVVKDPEQRGGWAFGSQRKKGVVLSHISLEAIEQPSREHAGKVKVFASKDRPGWHKRHGPSHYVGTLEIDPTNGSTTWDLTLGNHDAGSPADVPGFRPTALMERVSRFIETSGSAQSQKQITDAVTGKRPWVISAVSMLVSEGFLEVEQGPRGAKLHRSKSAFRNDED